MMKANNVLTGELKDELLVLVRAPSVISEFTRNFVENEERAARAQKTCQS